MLLEAISDDYNSCGQRLFIALWPIWSGEAASSEILEFLTLLVEPPCTFAQELQLLPCQFTSLTLCSGLESLPFGPRHT